MTRPLNSTERRLIQAFAERVDPPASEQLLRDLELASAEAVLPDGSIVRFHLDGYVRPPYRGQHTIGVEATLEDKDGATVTVLLHQDEQNRLFELELVRFAEGDLIEPRWDTVRFGAGDS